jgi:hypothetical protein
VILLVLNHVREIHIEVFDVAILVRLDFFSFFRRFLLLLYFFFFLFWIFLELLQLNQRVAHNEVIDGYFIAEGERDILNFGAGIEVV